MCVLGSGLTTVGDQALSHQFGLENSMVRPESANDAGEKMPMVSSRSSVYKPASGGMKRVRRPCSTHALLNMHTLHGSSRVASSRAVATRGAADVNEAKVGVATGRGGRWAAPHAGSRCCGTPALCSPDDCVDTRWYKQKQKKMKRKHGVQNRNAAIKIAI
jgi:hypothetical protein